MEATCRDGNVSMAHQDRRLIDSLLSAVLCFPLTGSKTLNPFTKLKGGGTRESAAYTRKIPDFHTHGSNAAC